MISIIIPVFKVEKYIRRCIESVLSQTYTDWELLLIDDGSPDRCGIICDEYSNEDERIIVFHKENSGVSSARNFGIDNAHGDWILFVDSDDWIEPTYIDSFLKKNYKGQKLIIQGRFNDFENGTIDKITFREKIYDKDSIVKGISENNLLSFGAPYCKLYNHSIIKNNNIRFPENYSYGEDTFFFFKYLMYVDGLFLINEIGYHYIHYEGSNLSVKPHMSENLIQFLDDSYSIINCLDDKNRTLKDLYTPTGILLVKRAIINLYILRRDKVDRLSLINKVKESILLNIDLKKIENCSDLILLLLTIYLPSSFIDLQMRFLTKCGRTNNKYNAKV